MIQWRIEYSRRNGVLNTRKGYVQRTTDGDELNSDHCCRSNEISSTYTDHSFSHVYLADFFVKIGCYPKTTMSNRLAKGLTIHKDNLYLCMVRPRVARLGHGCRGGSIQL